MTPTSLAHLTWQRTAILLGMLAFSSFVLWLTASHFDASERKTRLGLATGFIVREFLPIVKQMLGPMGETFTSGGQVE
jgi:hypothetical protein